MSPTNIPERISIRAAARLPIRSAAEAYGLGWDTVTQPGLRAVGVRGWQKGGDNADYGATTVVAAEVELGAG